MSKQSLRNEIQEFQGEKKKIIPAFLLLGVIGLLVPVLPGLLLILIALLLLSPKRGEEVMSKIRHVFRHVL